MFACTSVGFNQSNETRRTSEIIDESLLITRHSCQFSEFLLFFVMSSKLKCFSRLSPNDV